MGRVHDNNFKVRVPVNMLQLTERDGSVWPVAFDWEAGGETERFEIDRVLSRTPLAEQKSGAVGDCYECSINGEIEDIFYSILTPRKWFRLLTVNEDDYKRYYRLANERSN